VSFSFLLLSPFPIHTTNGFFYQVLCTDRRYLTQN